MKTSMILPYSMLDKESWTVDFLALDTYDDKDNRIKLSDLALINKLRLDSKELDSNKKYPYIEVKDIDVDTKMLIKDNTLLNSDEFPARAKCIAKKGDVLLSMVRPERGAVAIVPDQHEEYIVSSTIAVLTPKGISSELLYFMLSKSTVLSELSAMANGGVAPTLSLKHLRNYLLPMSIAPYDKAKKAIELYDRWLNLNTSTIALSEVTEEAFGKNLLDKNIDVDSNVTQKKYTVQPYALLGDRLDAEYYFSLEKEAAHWKCKVVNLNAIASFKSIPRKPVCNEIFHIKVPVLKVQDLEEEKIFADERIVEFVDCEEDLKNNYDYLEPGDIVIPRKGINIGKASIIPETLRGGLANQHIFVLNPLSEIILTEYLAFFLKSKWLEEYVETLAPNIVHVTLNKKSLGEFKLPLPDICTQKKIADEILARTGSHDKDELKKEISKFVDGL